MRRSFKMQNLDCANCAAKMEKDISNLPQVNKATISFMTQKLMLDAAVDSADELPAILDEAQRICSSYEKDCVILR